MTDEFDAEAPVAENPSPVQPQPSVDRLSRWLLGVTLALVILLIVTGISVVMYAFALRDAPRTNAEYQIAVNQAATAADPSNATAWAKLSYAYAATGRYGTALATADRGRAASGSGLLLLVKADVLRESGDNQAALKAYDAALSATKASVAAARSKLASENIYMGLGAGSAEAPIYYGRGRTKHALGDLDGAIADLQQAVKISPTEANLWVLLGTYEYEAGQFKPAKAAYLSALKLVPGMPEAQSGLERLRQGGH